MRFPRWLKALAHPLGLALFLISATLAIVVASIAPWSGRAVWLLVWGLIAYFAVVLAAAVQRRSFPSPVAVPFVARDLVEPPAPLPREDLVRMTEEALRRLNNPATLATCALGPRIPRTLAAFSGSQRGPTSESTPLEQARALRAVLVSCIERMKTEGPLHSMEAENLPYIILHDEYVLGRPNNQIMTRHSMSESTFHRYRRGAMWALAAELERQEDLLARDDTGHGGSAPLP